MCKVSACTAMFVPISQLRRSRLRERKQFVQIPKVSRQSKDGIQGSSCSDRVTLCCPEGGTEAAGKGKEKVAGGTASQTSGDGSSSHGSPLLGRTRGIL